MSAYRFSIRCDVERNVMYIEQSGQPTTAGLIDLKGAFLSEITRLRDGVTIVNDQRRMEALDAEAMKMAKEIVAMTSRHGVTRVIRVVPPDFLSTVQISESLVEGRSSYSSIRVSSVEEAEEALGVFLEEPDLS